MKEALFALVGYLTGSLPFGYWVVRFTRGKDIRRLGSGNIGATNVWRVYGIRYGLPVAILDVAKGFVPALVATLVAGDLAGVLAGGGAMLGHWRPVFLRFAKGGKMVATAGGAFFAVAPIVGLVCTALWILVFLVTRYASVASITGALAAPAVAVLLGEPWPVVAFCAIAAAGVVLLHRANLRRLFAGEEPRVELRAIVSR
jgi:glycerol-3-phosphate acyltransferase PlsY